MTRCTPGGTESHCREPGGRLHAPSRRCGGQASAPSPSSASPELRAPLPAKRLACVLPRLAPMIEVRHLGVVAAAVGDSQAPTRGGRERHEAPLPVALDVREPDAAEQRDVPLGHAATLTARRERGAAQPGSVVDGRLHRPTDPGHSVPARWSWHCGGDLHSGGSRWNGSCRRQVGIIRLGHQRPSQSLRRRELPSTHSTHDPAGFLATESLLIRTVRGNYSWSRPVTGPPTQREVQKFLLARNLCLLISHHGPEVDAPMRGILPWVFRWCCRVRIGIQSTRAAFFNINTPESRGVFPRMRQPQLICRLRTCLRLQRDGHKPSVSSAQSKCLFVGLTIYEMGRRNVPKQQLF